MCNLNVAMACPVCGQDMNAAYLYIVEDTQGRYLLGGCCSVEGMYVHATLQEAERSLSRYKGLAVRAGIRKAWKRLEEQFDAARAQFSEDCDNFLLEEADPALGGMYYVGDRVYCWECTPKAGGAPERAYNTTRPLQCCKCCRVGKAG